MTTSRSYLAQGLYPLREGMTHDGNVALSWGLWEVPEADNEPRWADEPGRA